MFLPEGQDPDTQVRLEGANKFIGLISQAKPLMEFFFDNLKSQINLNSMRWQSATS